MRAKKQQVDLAYAKTEHYTKVLHEIVDQGVCPFCPGNFKWHPHPILREEDGWFITAQLQPYEHTAHHFLLIRSVHAERLEELADKDWVTLGKLCRWAVKEFDLPGGGTTMRWGETKYTGATVRHLHAHLIVPEINPTTGRAYPVSFPIG